MYYFILQLSTFSPVFSDWDLPCKNASLVFLSSVLVALETGLVRGIVDPRIPLFCAWLSIAHHSQFGPTSSPGPSPRSNGGQRNPWPRLLTWLQTLKFRPAKTMKCLRFVWITVSDCRRQTGPPDAGNNLRKSHFIMCHVTKYSAILGVFQQPWPGVSPTAILNEEKALGTRLSLARKRWGREWFGR